MKNFLKNIFKIKYKFSFPERKNILIYDQHSEKTLKKIINSDYSIINCRKEKIFLPILLITILKNYSNFFKQFYFNYLKELIKYHNPKKIVTIVDNDIGFYKLKKYFNNVKFISIQNGYRFYKNDLFQKISESNENYLCDEFYCFGNNVENFLKNKIKAKYYSIGSLKNNFCLNIMEKKSNEVCFISSYGITNFKSEKFIIDFLGEFCVKYNLNLSILARTTKAEEREFYNSLVKRIEFKYYNQTDEFCNSYNVLDRSILSISLNNTLGYENIARGNKTFFFLTNDRNTGCSSFLKFGYPEEFKKEIIFCTKSLEKKIISEKINKVFSMSSVEWNEISKPIIKNIISYDENNKFLLKNLM